MKLGKRIVNYYGNKPKEGETGKTYFSLIIENLSDLEKYSEYYLPIVAKQNINALIGFKSQSFRSDFNNYLVHESNNVPIETKYVGLKLYFKETHTSLIEFCEMSDNLMIRKISDINGLINRGYIIRINSGGTYCTENDLSVFDEIIEIDELSVKMFIQTGKHDYEKLYIKSRTIIIENDIEVDSKFMSNIHCLLGRHNIEILNNFKNRCLYFTEQDFIELIETGFGNGLKNICFQTTGQDFNNLKKLQKILYSTIKKPVNIYISSDNEIVFENFKNTDMITIHKV